MLAACSISFLLAIWLFKLSQIPRQKMGEHACFPFNPRLNRVDKPKSSDSPDYQQRGQSNRWNRKRESAGVVPGCLSRRKGDGMANPRVIGLIAALLVSPALLPAQNTQPLNAAQRKDRAITAEMEVEGVELVALEKETAHAKALNNSSFFQRVYSDDYVGTTPWGEVLNRSALVASIQNSAAKYSSFIATDIHVRIYGP